MKSRLEEVLAEAADLLRLLETRFALVGGLAVSMRAEARFTRDVDLALSVTDDGQAERVVAAFVQRGYAAHIVVEQKEARRLATVRLLPPGEPEDGVVLDLLFASSGIEPELVAAAETMEVFPNITVPVATTGHLLATKLLARAENRPQDSIDLYHLKQNASPGELSRCRSALEQIEERGFARGKSLIEDWAGLLDPG